MAARGSKRSRESSQPASLYDLMTSHSEVDKNLPWNQRLSNAQIDELSTKLIEVKQEVVQLRKERDFYYGKLRDIEILLGALEDREHNPVIQSVLAILYEVKDGFIPPEFKVKPRK